MKAYAISTARQIHGSYRRSTRSSDKTSTQSLLAVFDPAGLDWLTKAAELPGKSLHLAMVLVLFANTANSHQVALNDPGLRWRYRAAAARNAIRALGSA